MVPCKKFVLAASLVVIAVGLSFPNISLASGITTLEIATALVANHIGEEHNEIAGAGHEVCLASGRAGYECPSYIKLGQGICLSGGRPSYECPGYTKLGQGICLAGGRPSYECPSHTSIGQGICLSTGRPSYECQSYTTYEQGLCLAKGHPSYKCTNISLASALALEVLDIDWAWDQFYGEDGRARWQCRGKSTGEFADDYKCSSDSKTDTTWPGM